MVNSTPQPLYLPETQAIPIVREVGYAPGPVWTSSKSLTSTDIRSPDRLAGSESLHRLRNVGRHKHVATQHIQG
jgi:hypothetical protein